MADNHPAHIAKYLLKGWCLLNEYCPEGSNIPLVRSREGQLLCVACNPSCPHFATYGEQSQSQSAAPAQPKAAPETVIAEPAQEAKVIRPVQIQLEEEAKPMEEERFAPPARSMQAAGLETPEPLQPCSEVAVQGADLGFGSVRLVLSSCDSGPRLAGDYFRVRARLGLLGQGTGLEAEELREALQVECNHLAQRVLVPESQVDRGGGLVSCACKDGKQITLPESDCVILRAQRVTPEVVASMFWDRLVATPVVEGFRTAGAQWLEVGIAGSTAEAAIRRPLERRSASAMPP